MRIVTITMALTDALVIALVRSAKWLDCGGDIPEDIPGETIECLMAQGLLEQMANSDYRVTVAGHLVLIATGNESVVKI